MKLLDYLKETYNLASDAEISRKLNVAPPVISRLRNGKIKASADIILRVHEVFEIPVKDIKELI